MEFQALKTMANPCLLPNLQRFKLNAGPYEALLMYLVQHSVLNLDSSPCKKAVDQGTCPTTPQHAPQKNGGDNAARWGRTRTPVRQGSSPDTSEK